METYQILNRFQVTALGYRFVIFIVIAYNPNQHKMLLALYVVFYLLQSYLGHAMRISSEKSREYTYVVRIELYLTQGGQEFHSPLCTGTVLSSTSTLTAGNCVKTYEIIRFSPSFQARNAKGVLRYPWGYPEADKSDYYGDIINSLIHPGFRIVIFKPSMRIRNDIGLLKTTPIKLDVYGKLSSLDVSVLSGQAALAAGYGRDRADALQKPIEVVPVIMLPCSVSLLEKSDAIYPALCVRKRCGQRSLLCAGDGGGPLLHASGVAAVTSVTSRRGCSLKPKMGDSSRFVAFTTPVSPYLDWIYDGVLKNAQN